MIVKGKPRSGPEQLAAYLMRTHDGERATLLQLDSGDGDLRKAFLVWHSVGEATRGKHTLYHAQIAPDPRYKLTPQQCRRAAQILAEDLGMANHPRAVILHDGGDKPHIHVVLMRTNLDTMKMWHDHKNWVKHENASHRMELEFGHEVVPGKHARKRNRKKQPEMPRAKATQADYQQAERTGMSFDERRDYIAGIRKSCDNVQAFKNALEDAGYLLAKGDKRGFVLVDGGGEVFSLSKHLAGDIKGKEYKAFMASIDEADLPSVDEAKAIQKQRQQGAAVIAEKSPQEASKFLPDQTPQKAHQPAAGSEKPKEQARPEETRVQREPAAKDPRAESSKFLRPVAPQQEIPAPAAPVVLAQPAAQQREKKCVLELEAEEREKQINKEKEDELRRGRISGSRFMQQPESPQQKVAAVSRFLAKADLEARVSRFLARHQMISRFVSLHVPVLCPFLPLPTGAQTARPDANIPAPEPRPHRTRFITLNL